MFHRHRRAVHAGYLLMLAVTVAGVLAATLPALSPRLEAAAVALALAWVLYVAMSRERLRLAGDTVTDPLTGLYNRRYMPDRMREEINRAQRYRGRFAVAMIDIDDFKQVNEVQGHAAGDAVLREVSQHLQSQLRWADLIFRYGGEEFVVLMPDTEGPAAADGLLRLQGDLATSLGLTFSGGVAAFPVDGQTSEALLRKADGRLHLAKHSGKARMFWNDAGAEVLAANTAG